MFRVNHSIPAASYYVYTCFGPVYTLLDNTKLVSSNFNLFRVNQSISIKALLMDSRHSSKYTTNRTIKN
nr:MAG TPA: hypothetical protein [Caudoviricetes sp.]